MGISKMKQGKGGKRRLKSKGVAKLQRKRETITTNKAKTIVTNTANNETSSRI